MIGARIFNKREGNSIEEIYGVVTTGNLWQFSVLRKTHAEIDPKTFDISGGLEQILGILWAMTFSKISL